MGKARPPSVPPPRASRHIGSQRPLERSKWIAAALGLVLALGWTLVPAARVVVITAAVAVIVAWIQRLSDPRCAPGGDPPTAAADPVQLLAALGLRDLEEHLAHHAAFAEYLERRNAGDPELDGRSVG
jgi:hypothetical protein